MRNDHSVRRRRALAVWGITACLLLGSAAAVLWMRHAQRKGSYAYIYQKGELLRRVDLSDVQEPYEIRIEGGKHVYNVLEVRRGSIGMTDASCPDQICMHMGFINNSRMPVTCMPNQVVVKIVSEDADELDSIDGVSY